MTLEYKDYVIDASYLFPPSLADFLGPNDEVHAFAEVTEHLDVSGLDSDFNGMGQHPYHPRLLLRLLMWGMANRIVSTRKIEIQTRRDVSFIYLAGGQRPDFRTLARFRRRNAKKIGGLFKDTVMLCARLGMVKLGHVALDGTKLKANTSKHKAMSYGRMKQEEKRLEKEIEELMQQAEVADSEEDKAFGRDNNGYNLPEELHRREDRLAKICELREELEREKREEEQAKGKKRTPVMEDKEQRSFADREARMMLMKRGEFDYAYNAQAGIDEGHGIIVAAELSNEASDTVHLPAAVEEVRELRQELGKTEEETTEMTEDTGYFSAENIQQEGKGIELLIASGREDKDEAGDERDEVYSVEKFTYVKYSDSWRCPEGRLLEREKSHGGKGRPKLRRYLCADCDGCGLRAHCLKPGVERRLLLVKRKQLIKAEMRARLKDPVKKAIYRKRKWVAEQVIGQIKEALGFREFTVRGENFARAQWLFVCAVHNVMKAVRFTSDPRKLNEVGVQTVAA